MNTKKTMLEILRDENLCLTTNPQGTDKGSYKSYIEKLYEIEFAKYRNQPIRIMEIGFRHGASLALWSKYFDDVNILGLDNYSDIAVTEELPIVKEWVEQKNIEVKIGDAYDAAFANGINYEFDIVIDDGPHWLDTQIKAIKLYLPKLKDDGVFIIEDILAGEKSIPSLMFATPLNYNGEFNQYRDSPDNSIYAIRKNRNILDGILNRISLMGQYAVFVTGKIIKKLTK